MARFNDFKYDQMNEDDSHLSIDEEQNMDDEDGLEDNEDAIHSNIPQPVRIPKVEIDQYDEIQEEQKVISPWSVDEDEALLVGIQVFGRWDFLKIVKLIPGRDVESIKDRIKTLFRWKIKANPAEAAAKCSGINNPTTSDINAQLYRIANRSQMNEVIEERKPEIRQKLTEEKRRLLESFLRERSLRKVNITTDEEMERELEQSERVADLMEAALVIEQSDIDAYYSEGPQAEPISKNANPQEVSLPFRSKRRRRHTRRKRVPASPSSRFSDHPIIVRPEMNEQMYAEKSQPIQFPIILPKPIIQPKSEPVYKIEKFVSGGNTRKQVLMGILDSILCTIEAPDPYASRQKIACWALPDKTVTGYLLNSLSGNGLHDKPSKFAPLLMISSKDDIKEVPREEVDYGFGCILSKLIPPSLASCNLMYHYKKNIQSMLTSSSLSLFKSSSELADKEKDGLSDIRLSNEVKADPSYKLLKERMTRLFLLPLLMKRVMESDSSCQKRKEFHQNLANLKQKQTDKLTEAGYQIVGRMFARRGHTLEQSSETNNEIYKSLTKIIPFKIYNPLYTQLPSNVEVQQDNFQERPEQKRYIFHQEEINPLLKKPKYVVIKKSAASSSLNSPTTSFGHPTFTDSMTSNEKLLSLSNISTQHQPVIKSEFSYLPEEESIMSTSTPINQYTNDPQLLRQLLAKKAAARAQIPFPRYSNVNLKKFDAQINGKINQGNHLSNLRR